MPASTGPHACRRNLPWLGAVRLPRRITEHPALARRPDQALTYPSDTYVSGHLTRLGPRHDVLIQQPLPSPKAQAANEVATFNPATVHQTVDRASTRGPSSAPASTASHSRPPPS
jgi:hypothetical protein